MFKTSRARRTVLLLATATLSALATPLAAATELRITVRQVLPGKGELMVALFDRAAGFPDQPTATQPAQRVKPDGETVTLTFSGLAEGRWAVMVLQDLNGNGRADYNLVGLPKEPYGASNNRLPKLSPPKFEEALVEVGPQGAAITIDLRRP
jgi:uncharacterized protein (DUF2141 family)